MEDHNKKKGQASQSENGKSHTDAGKKAAWGEESKGKSANESSSSSHKGHSHKNEDNM